MTMEASQKKEQTLQWDLTRTQMEPSIRTEVEDTVSYMYTQTMGGLDFSRKDSQHAADSDIFSGGQSNRNKAKKSRTEI